MRRGVRLVKLVSVFALACGSWSADAKCVRIYYDRVPNAQPAYQFGRVHALMLQNLLGHFPEVQQYIAPIETYRAGDIETCQATIYLGTYYDNAVPQAFYDDFATTRRNVVWAGYNVWRYDEPTLARLWGVRYAGLSTLDAEHRDEHGMPGFYRNYLYKGERFSKYAGFDFMQATTFNAAFEITLVEPVDARAEQDVVAWAEHTTGGPRTPYVVRRDNRWLFGDSPFSFIVEQDRYLIAADQLFDILDEPPRHPEGPRPALIRVEDVHARLPLWQLYTFTDMLASKHVPFTMSVIPIFSDPYGVYTYDLSERFTTMERQPLFVDFLRYAERHGVCYIYHGVTHQAGRRRNPFNGLTGDDFEFWDRVQNKPMARDGASFVTERLEDGLSILSRVGIRPAAWLTPHYQASPVDYTTFGQLFTWNIGRIIYFPHVRRQAARLPLNLTIDAAGAEANGRRAAYLGDLTVEYPQEMGPNGQFFPYEIFGDVYGQRIIPENVGNVQPYMNEQVHRAWKIDDMIATMRRNRVLRDSWASFFVHPFSISTQQNAGVGVFPGDTREIERLIDAAREYGYEFIDLNRFVRETPPLLRPEPIETP